MKEFFKKMIGGLAVGLGFMAATVAVFYASTGLLIGKMTEEAYAEAEQQMSTTVGFKEFGPDSGLIVKNHHDRAIENGVEILAEVENTGEDSWSGVNLEVELFDDQDEFVDECSEYLRGKIGPNETKNAVVKCGGCKDNALAAFSRYTINVVDASSF